MSRFLFLQGPMSTFFDDLISQIHEEGHSATKIIFNPGDKTHPASEFYQDYTGTFEEWPKYFEKLVNSRGITDIALYGDCRPYHERAIKVAKFLNLRIWVFEEGYLRPEFVTIEKDGVNANGSFRFYQHGKMAEIEGEVPRRSVPSRMVSLHRNRQAISYYWRVFWKDCHYMNYISHRKYIPNEEFFIWLLAYGRRAAYKLTQSSKRKKFEEWTENKHFYFVPLQVHNDSQIKTHSDYESVWKFIEEVLYSFAANAPSESALVFKHHPMDVGYEQYQSRINDLAYGLGIKERVLYGHGFDLTRALKNTAGVVLVNSTVGISALLHGRKVKCMGKANYDLGGLCFKGGLVDFWKSNFEPSKRLVREFVTQLRLETQIQGNYYCYDSAFIERCAEFLTGNPDKRLNKMKKEQRDSSNTKA
ncbi:capsular biosynthesis protein [Vibrio barjaei]|uniref:capsular biosynthesis protein n=1 Tax=Vibrio barjaei TaxID=1676683 RepID=UPI002283B737|nr:capsular biosynthesis protein [Vibrio barjaei]MCY9872367.1 capsular biosynthesis protein [Vibrio barjaei]